MIVQYASTPCWQLVWPGREPGETHFNSDREALEPYYYGDEEQPIAVQCEQPCWLLTCDGCGADPDGDDFDHIHWPDPETARAEADSYDYVTVGDDVWCELCKTEPHEHVGEPAAACGRCGRSDSEHGDVSPS